MRYRSILNHRSQELDDSLVLTLGQVLFRPAQGLPETILPYSVHPAADQALANSGLDEAQIQALKAGQPPP